jgi:hypothetical protein
VNAHSREVTKLVFGGNARHTSPCVQSGARVQGVWSDGGGGVVSEGGGVRSEGGGGVESETGDGMVAPRSDG